MKVNKTVQVSFIYIEKFATTLALGVLVHKSQIVRFVKSRIIDI